MANELETSEFLDSRDLIERLEELESMEESERIEEDVQDEYTELLRVCEEGEDSSSDWSYGETLIRSDCFTDYIMETPEDFGYLPKDMPWWIAIDREQTAENCRADYTYINIYDETYYLRNN